MITRFPLFKVTYPLDVAVNCWRITELLLNQLRTTSLSIPPENIRKPLVFCFQGVQKQTSDMKWIKEQKVCYSQINSFMTEVPII